MNHEPSSEYLAWAEGYGVIRHAPETRERVQQLGYLLVECGQIPDVDAFYRLLAAADRLTSAAMWTVVHMTYAQRVDLSGAPLPAEAFKSTPEGHTGGSLNMVPAFVGYLTANAITAKTRSWMMGQSPRPLQARHGGVGGSRLANGNAARACGYGSSIGERGRACWWPKGG